MTAPCLADPVAQSSQDDAGLPSASDLPVDIEMLALEDFRPSFSAQRYIYCIEAAPFAFQLACSPIKTAH